MEFVSEKKDYNVTEFYEHFGEALPKVVKVNQGYFGEIASDVFDKDEVIWLYTISKQKRVIAKFQLPNHSMRLLSIPVTYEEKLCVVKHGKLGKPKLLKTILEKGHFPLSVQFPKDHQINVGSHSMNTNHIPKLELTETFDEMYFLGNYLNYGTMSDTVIEIPLYLSKLRFSLVTGIKDQTNDQWDYFVNTQANKSSTLVYDHTFGNPDIAEYDPKAIHSCDVYSFLEPTVYSNIVSLVSQPHLTPTSSHDSIEKEQSSPAEEKTNHDYDPVIFSGNGSKQTTVNNVNAHSTTYDAKPNVSGLRKVIPTPLVTIGPNTNVQTSQPELKPSTPTDKSSSKQHEKPTTKDTNGSTTSIQQTSHGGSHGPPPPPLKPKPTVHKKKLPQVHSSEDVAKLSIDEVGEYLKHLKLEQYVEVFKTSMIDGQLLMEVSKEMLIDEFHFKHSEVLRLIAFAKKGHVPL